MVPVCIRSSDESSRCGGRWAEYGRKLMSYCCRDFIDSTVRFQTNKKRKRACSGQCGDSVKDSSRVLAKFGKLRRMCFGTGKCRILILGLKSLRRKIVWMRSQATSLQILSDPHTIDNIERMISHSLRHV